MNIALPADLTVVVPCYNEINNVGPLVAALAQVLEGRQWEVVFVDDNSPDGTSRAVQALAARDPRIRLIRRVGRRGLSSAVIEGVMSSSAEVIAVMDGDLQHDEATLPLLVAPIFTNEADIVVASRYLDGGNSGGLANQRRHLISRSGIRLAQMILPIRLTDPMSGFFAVRRSLFEDLVPKLAGSGFKILLELVLSAPPVIRIREVPSVFRPRHSGESKLSSLVMLQFLGMLIERFCGGWLPTRFVVFACVGLVGVLINLLATGCARFAGTSFEHAQMFGTACAIMANFQFNNNITYHDRRLRGTRWWRGLVIFVLGCSLGAYANIGVAKMLYDTSGHWSRASGAGAAIGVVWNYAIASTLVWR